MRNKGIMLGLVLAAAGTTTFTTTPARALPSQEVSRYYYSDATMTNAVGYELVQSCYGGGFDVIGTATSYSVLVSEPCDGGGSNEIRCFLDGYLTTCPPNICDSGLFEC